MLRIPPLTRSRAGTTCKRILGAAPAKENTSFRQRPEDIRAFDVSCFPNAYRNSAATLRARIADHGANSPLVREWVIGQDAVLLNCEMDSPLPGELPNAPAWLKADRAYQIAAAYFYRLDYARAGALFAEIGRDASSPWQKAGRYLVARCAVHAANADKTPKLIADAQQAIDAVATDPDLGEYRADAPKLTSLLAFATRPQERAQELERALLAPDLPPTLAVELRDFLLLERTGTRYTDLGAWIYDIDVLAAGRDENVAAAKADALSRWRERRSLPWLVAALMHLAPGDNDGAAAIAASRAIDANSPAYYTLAWHRLRLLIGENKQDEARTELDQILDGRPLPEGVENLMRYHAMKLARDLDEFLRFAPRRGEFVMYLPDPRTKLDATALPLKPTSLLGDFNATLKWRTELFQPNPRYFDEDATEVMSRFMPLPMMARVAQSDRLPSNMQRDVALAVWTRAVLLEDAEIANAVAPSSRVIFLSTARAGKPIRAPPRRSRRNWNRRCCCYGCLPRAPGSLRGWVTLTCVTVSGSMGHAGGRVRTPMPNRRPMNRTMPRYATIAPFRCNWPRRHSSRSRIATARAMTSPACASSPGHPPISAPSSCPGQNHRPGIPGCPRRSTS
jgi:hypothetical protein